MGRKKLGADEVVETPVEETPVEETPVEVPALPMRPNSDYLEFGIIA